MAFPWLASGGGSMVTPSASVRQTSSRSARAQVSEPVEMWMQLLQLLATETRTKDQEEQHSPLCAVAFSLPPRWGYFFACRAIFSLARRSASYYFALPLPSFLASNLHRRACVQASSVGALALPTRTSLEVRHRLLPLSAEPMLVHARLSQRHRKTAGRHADG